MDNSKAFDGDADEKGYDQVMTTKSEFLKILDSMYAKGYVLVKLHDIAHEETDENGNAKMVPGTNPAAGPERSHSSCRRMISATMST